MAVLVLVEGGKVKITYKSKDTWWGKKIEIEIFDFQGMQQELEAILEGLKVIKK